MRTNTTLLQQKMALIRRRLLESSQVAIRLAVYGGQPAIFFQAAPDDKAKGWTSVAQYPRIVLTMDEFESAGRNTMGVLTVDVLCTEAGILPEEIEPFVREALEGVLFTPKGAATFSPNWRRTEIFRERSVTDDSFNVGMTLSFDIYEFPFLESGDPDPVTAISYYAEDWDRALLVIGRAEMPEILEPSRESPVAYFRRLNATIEKQTNTVVWLLCDLAVHLFAPELKDRLEWLEQFAQSLALDGEVTMLDGSPMFIRDVKGNANADEVTGQLTVSVRYGLLRRPRYAHTMMEARWEKG